MSINTSIFGVPFPSTFDVSGLLYAFESWTGVDVNGTNQVVNWKNQGTAGNLAPANSPGIIKSTGVDNVPKLVLDGTSNSTLVTNTSVVLPLNHFIISVFKFNQNSFTTSMAFSHPYGASPSPIVELGTYSEGAGYKIRMRYNGVDTASSTPNSALNNVAIVIQIEESLSSHKIYLNGGNAWINNNQTITQTITSGFGGIGRHSNTGQYGKGDYYALYVGKLNKQDINKLVETRILKQIPSLSSLWSSIN